MAAGPVTDLADACQDLAGLLPQIERLVARKPGRGAPITGPGFGTAPPWYAPAAHIALAIHAGVRRVEASLRADAGLPPRRRGGSHANTFAALAAIEALETAVPQSSASWATSRLALWASHARALEGIDEAPAWEPIRRGPAGAPTRCPYCHTYSLRVAKAALTVTCFYPGCQDKDGQTPMGRMERTPTGDPRVVWDDGLVITPASVLPSTQRAAFPPRRAARRRRDGRSPPECHDQAVAWGPEEFRPRGPRPPPRRGPPVF